MATTEKYSLTLRATAVPLTTYWLIVKLYISHIFTTALQRSYFWIGRDIGELSTPPPCRYHARQIFLCGRWPLLRRARIAPRCQDANASRVLPLDLLNSIKRGRGILVLEKSCTGVIIELLLKKADCLALSEIP